MTKDLFLSFITHAFTNILTMTLSFLSNHVFTLNPTVPSPLTVDVHCHLLPAVDEGPKTVQESLVLIQQLFQLGFRKLILTPHIMEGFYPNSVEHIKAQVVLLREQLLAHNIEVEIVAGAEYYLDQQFLRLLLGKHEMLYFKGTNANKYILFETQHLHEPKQLFECIKRIHRRGFIAVLAHPERYHYLQHNRILVHQLFKLGVLFQVNINSFSGYYGNASRELAEYLSVAKMIHFLATDCHKKEHIEMLQKTMNSTIYPTLLAAKTVLNNQI
jgi:tyrosine-protein phosphatase YwqE